MKVYFYICLMLCLVACTKQDEYKKYINGEERIYRAKPSQLKISPGYLKAEVKFKLYSPIHVEKYEIYADNIKVAEGNVSYADSMLIETVINDLQEKTYQIDVVTVDDAGLSSVKTTGFLNVYGPRLQSSLNQRVPSKISSDGPGEVTLLFPEAEANIVRSQITYLNVLGKVVNKSVNKDESELILKDVDPNGYLKYATYILPSATSLDTLLTQEETVQMKDVERKWFSSEERNGEGANNGRVQHMFDGNNSTYWHSQYQGSSFSYPHWFIMELNTVATINSFTITRRQGSNTGPSKIKLEVKNIGEDWTNLGTFTVNNQVDGPQVLSVGATIKKKFVKVTALEGAAAHICIAEFTIK